MRTILINKKLWVTLLVLTCTTALAGVRPHDYVIRVDPALRQLSVEARFSEPVASVRARAWDAERYLQQIRDCTTDQVIRVRNRRMILPVGGVTCLRYTVDIAKAARAERRNATLSSDNIIVSPAAWFWRPALHSGASIQVRFELDAKLRVSVPWQPIAGEANTYRLGVSPESSKAPAIFGDFDYHESSIPGAVLRINVLNSDRRFDADDIVEWVRSSASNVSLAYGMFPNPSPSVVVLPVGGSRYGDSPVPFGRVVRDGGETIELFINQNMPIERFYDDWTATHEFSHLMLPFLHARHRWISEGFAQYYQNILLARAGQYSEQRAWQKLYEGLERGRKSSPSLSPNDAANDRRGSLMKVYWSGAAIALLADVELRRQSNGEQSLDDVLHKFQLCCLPSERAWSGTQLFARLDGFLETPIFMPLYRRYADTAGFPDVRPLLAELGVIVDDDTVSLEQDAILAALRTAMMAH